MIGHLHADRDQIDGRISRELLGVRKRERDPEMLEGIVFEEYRLRRQAGELPCPTEYRRRFGISLSL